MWVVCHFLCAGDKRETKHGWKERERMSAELVASTGSVDVDWFEDSESHIFLFNLPGIRAADVKTQVIDNNVLQVSGIRQPTQLYGSQYGAKWHVKERPSGAFSRTFKLPTNIIRVQDVQLKDVDGVLTIKIPKQTFVRNIPIY